MAEAYKIMKGIDQASLLLLITFVCNKRKERELKIEQQQAKEWFIRVSEKVQHMVYAFNLWNSELQDEMKPKQFTLIKSNTNLLLILK